VGVVADEPILTQSAIIMGWLAMRDIRRATLDRAHVVDGKVRLLQRMQPLADLVPWTLEEGRKPPPPPVNLMPEDFIDTPSDGRRIVVGPDGPRFEDAE
jgi:hypothetical protein